MLNTIEIITLLQSILGSFILFIFGAAIGSFVMVASNRLRVKSFGNSRSVCMSCNKTLLWYELIPIFSFILQDGRCRNCKSKINFSLFIVELISGIVFAFLPFVIMGYTQDFTIQLSIFVLFLLVYIFALFISIYDIKHKIINLESLLMLFVLAIISQIGLQYYDDYININYYYLLSPIVVSGLFVFLFIISRGRWIGFGDVLLFFVFGLMLPLHIAISGVFIAVWIGAVVSLLLHIFKSQKYNSQTEIPFGPFIVLGFLLSFFFNLDLLNIGFLFLN